MSGSHMSMGSSLHSALGGRVSDEISGVRTDREEYTEVGEVYKHWDTNLQECHVCNETTMRSYSNAIVHPGTVTGN